MDSNTETGTIHPEPEIIYNYVITGIITLARVGNRTLPQIAHGRSDHYATKVEEENCLNALIMNMYVTCFSIIKLEPLLSLMKADLCTMGPKMYFFFSNKRNYMTG